MSKISLVLISTQKTTTLLLFILASTQVNVLSLYGEARRFTCSTQLCIALESRLYDFPHNPSSSPSGSSPGRRGDLRGDVAVPPLPVSVHRLAPGHHRFARRLPLLELWRYSVSSAMDLLHPLWIYYI
ncbi:uncharacterized protein [Miscanthus floridulus]|uniref:uncharacterized protein n=1 Tax=Miscanthus floridulus TaxID=154761 RepID=UPI003459F76D